MSENAIEERNKFYRTVSCGNAIAYEFLVQFHEYCHEVDDIIDLPDWSPERVLNCFALACRLYSHPFYTQHRKAIGPAILVATSLYQDANKWEQDPALWKQWWADVLRHAGNQVTFTIAQLCGGWTHMKGLTAPLMASSYIYHADKYGTPGNPKEAQ